MKGGDPVKKEKVVRVFVDIPAKVHAAMKAEAKSRGVFLRRVIEEKLMSASVPKAVEISTEKKEK